MTTSPVLLLHLVGAAVTLIICVLAIIPQNNSSPRTRHLTVWLLTLITLQTITGSLLGLLAGASPFTYCANLTVYLMIVGAVLYRLALHQPQYKSFIIPCFMLNVGLMATTTTILALPTAIVSSFF